MKKITIFFVLHLFLFPIHSHAQVPEIIWQEVIGGFEPDYIKEMLATADGGYIIGGRSLSGIGGDKTEAYFGGSSYGDYWVLKIDADRNIEWQKTLGGSQDDEAQDIVITPDGGYVIVGSSRSPVSGNKTEPSVMNDYWAVKLNALGAIVWQNTISSSLGDDAYNVDIAGDGNIIISGSSTSDISGDKIENSNGSSDIWMVKLNNTTGNIMGQNNFGGGSSDLCYAMDATSDGGCIIGASSNSLISGDKTVNTNGGYDFYIVKLNSIGVIEWQKSFGGIKNEYCYAISQTTDGGYIVGGNSNSGISGNKTRPNIDEDEIWTDNWILKLDAAGNLQWENSFGGELNDRVSDIAELENGGFLLISSSNSSYDGDKTEINMGSVAYTDTWLLRLDQNGNLVWQNTIGAEVNETGGTVIIEDDGFVIGCSSGSVISGDKTIAPVGNNDIWIYKIESECGLGNEICNGYDDDCNDLIDDMITESATIYTDDDIAFCAGESATLTAISTGPKQWRKNGVPIPGAIFTNYIATLKGVYSCSTTTVCGSDISENITITVYKNPPAIITADGPITFCEGESVLLTANSGAGLSYQWLKNGNDIVGATTNNYTASVQGNYSCEVTKNTTGCKTVSNGIKVKVTCRQEEVLVNKNNSFAIYPNPNNGTFTISMASVSPGQLKNTLEIYNSLGQLIFSKELTVSDRNINETISIDNLSSGIYFIRFNKADQKLIINK